MINHKHLIIDGSAIAKELLQSLSKKVAQVRKQGIVPTLAVVQIGTNASSRKYIDKKKEAAEKVGITVRSYHITATKKGNAIIKMIHAIQAIKPLHGCIIQLPLPKVLRGYTNEILNSIREDLDIDCLTDRSFARLTKKSLPWLPPTPAAILHIIKQTKVNLARKHVVIVGRGALIGKPLTCILMGMPVTVTVCGQHSLPLGRYTKEADILISGVGIPGIINYSMIKQGAMVIDAGFKMKKGKIKGDVSAVRIKSRAAYFTPVPGGVGPVTVAKLLENVVKNAVRISYK